MLVMGTDGCRHLSPVRWDPEAYFEPDKDSGVIQGSGRVCSEQFRTLPLDSWLQQTSLVSRCPS